MRIPFVVWSVRQAFPQGELAAVLRDFFLPPRDWLAGHFGFEPANPSASYLIGIAGQLRLR
jgi:hypothetical protein